MNDLVEVTGTFNRTPLLRFVQKGKGVTSLTGEKLYEAQVIDAVQAAIGARSFASRFFVCVADEATMSYRVFVELDETGGMARPEGWDLQDLATAVEGRLNTTNLKYHGKRSSGRLGPLTVVRLAAGTGQAFKAACVRAGQREGQFKPTVLQYRRDLAFAIDEYVAE